MAPHPAVVIVALIGVAFLAVGALMVGGVVSQSVTIPGVNGCVPASAIINPCGITVRWTPSVETGANGSTTLKVTDQSIPGTNVTITSVTITWSTGGPSSTISAGGTAFHTYAGGIQNASVTDFATGFKTTNYVCPANACPVPGQSTVQTLVTGTSTALVQFSSPTSPPTAAFVNAAGEVVTTGLKATVFDLSSFGSLCGSPPAYADANGHPYVAETISWGDGSTTTGLVPSGWAANHTYAGPGTYPVSLSLVGITWFAQQGRPSCSNPYTILPHLWSNTTYKTTAVQPVSSTSAATNCTGATTAGCPNPPPGGNQKGLTLVSGGFLVGGLLTLVSAAFFQARRTGIGALNLALGLGIGLLPWLGRYLGWW